jgi:hypothetical protein
VFDVPEFKGSGVKWFVLHSEFEFAEPWNWNHGTGNIGTLEPWNSGTSIIQLVPVS